MRQVHRLALPPTAQRYLLNRQSAANEKLAQGRLHIDNHWKSARQTKSFNAVMTALHNMMGPRQRCMYCLDSHGADVEHFRPKAPYPQHMYEWSNLLLCCTECGRFKGSKFPLAGTRALLIDPTSENPWDHLDFDPVTGNISARFDLNLNDWSARGVATVETLQLDKREALSAGYLKTIRHLSDILRQALSGGTVDETALKNKMQSVDEHGLLEWCLSDRGQAVQAFKDLHQQHPDIWERLNNAM